MPVLNICAHQDDDLYFMSPDIIGDMNAAGTTAAAGSLYISAGDAGAGWGTYAQGRETGAKAAWAQMAGVSSPTWTNSTITLAGKTVSTSTLNGTSVRLVFLRIADGGYGGGGDPHYLAGLYDGTRSSLTALDSSNTYTKSEMTAVLTAAIGLYGATLVRHHNHLDDWGSEHYDHTACGRFAADAVAACTVPPAHVGYLGYRSNNATLWDNVSSANQTAKRAAFAAYAAYDTAISGTSWDNAWIPRQYKAGPFPTGTASGTTRRIFTSSDDSALGVNADTTATIVGMPFSVNADSLLTAITMMIPSGQNAAVTGTQVTAHLWTQTGTAGNYPDTYLGSAPAAYLTRGTRNVFTLTKPIRLTSGQWYWATMRFPAGYYPRTGGKFSSAGATSTDGRISTPANSTIANNQYSYDYLPYFGVGASPTNGNYGAAWYGLDVVVADLAATNPASLSASLPVLTSSISGTVANTATLSGALPVLTGSVSGTSINPATIAATLPKVTGSLAATAMNPAVLAGTLPKLTGTLADQASNAATLTATLPVITGTLTGTSTNPATIAGAAPALTGSLSATQTNPASLSGTLPKLTGALSDQAVNTATLAGTLPKTTGSINGQSINPGTVTAATPKTTGALTGTSVNSAVVAAALPVLAGTLTGDGSLNYGSPVHRPSLVLTVTAGGLTLTTAEAGMTVTTPASGLELTT